MDKMRSAMLHLQIQNAKLQQQMEQQQQQQQATVHATSKPEPAPPVHASSKPEPAAAVCATSKPEPAPPVHATSKPEPATPVLVAKPSVLDPSQLETQLIHEDAEIPPTQMSPDLELDGEAIEDEESEANDEWLEGMRAWEDDENWDENPGQPPYRYTMAVKDAAAEDSESEAKAELESLREDEQEAMLAVQRAQANLEEIKRKKLEAQKQKPEPASHSVTERVAAALKKMRPVDFDEVGSLSSTMVLGANGPRSNASIEDDKPHPEAASSNGPAPASTAIDGCPAGPATAEADVNTSTHKKEWARLDRLMTGPRGAEFPHMRALFQGSKADSCQDTLFYRKVF